MGDNSQGQLGIGTISTDGNPLPSFLDGLTFTKMTKIRAGSFSAALSADGLLFVWGEGTFGKFHSPHRVKSSKRIEIVDFQLSRSGLAAIVTQDGKLYTWGENDVGQLGHGDVIPRMAPSRVKTLTDRKVTGIGIGDNFCITLGRTLPQRNL